MTHEQLDLWVQDNWEKKIDSLFGLDADRPASAARPTIYFATDTDLPYFWADGPSWTEMGSGGTSADDYIKFNNWVDGTTYAIGDIIIEDNTIYSCNTAGAQSTDFTTNAAAWTGKVYKFHNTWIDGTTYAIGDTILEDGVTYTCNTAGAQSTDFTTNAAVWDSSVGGLRLVQAVGDITLNSFMDGSEIHVNTDNSTITVDLELVGRDFKCTVIDVSNGTQGFTVEMVFGGAITASALYMRDGRNTPEIGTTSGTTISFLRNESIDLRVNGVGEGRFINIKKFAGKAVAQSASGILQMTGIINNDTVTVPDKNMQLTMKSAPANAYVDNILALEDDDVSITVVYTLDLAGGTTPKITNPDNADEITTSSGITVNGQEVTAQYSLASLSTRPSFITIVHGDLEEQVDITWVDKPTLTPEFTGVYPTTNSITQIELQNGDNREVTLNTSDTTTVVQTQNLNGYNADIWNGSRTTIHPTSNYTLDTVVSRSVSIRFKNAEGTWSHWTDTTNTSDLSDYCPTYAPTVTYPTGQEAIKDTESVTIVPSTAVDIWVTTTLETLEANRLDYVTDSTGTQITRHTSCTYAEDADFNIRYFNTRNGKIVDVPGTIFIAHADVALAVNDPFQVISRASASAFNIPYTIDQLLMGETVHHIHEHGMVHPVHGAEPYADYDTSPQTENITVTNKAGKVTSLPRAYFFQGFEMITLTSVYAYSTDTYIDFPITHANGDPVIINNSKVVVSGNIDTSPVTGILTSGYVATDAELTSGHVWTHTTDGTVFRMNKKKLASVGWGSNGNNLTINIEETI